jgi:methionyl-tRNA formyltransferase
LQKEDGLIDWSSPAKAIANLIRGLDPWPTAYTYLDGELLKLFKARAISLDKKVEPGTILEIDSATIKVAAKDGAVLIEELQRPGKKRLKVSEFAKGYPACPGKRLG